MIRTDKQSPRQETPISLKVDGHGTPCPTPTKVMCPSYPVW